MFEEVKKSIYAVLYERLTSPLAGTFVFTWLIWNWKIWYVTFFIKQSSGLNKILYISEQLSDYYVSVIFPVISTLGLLLLYPFLSVAAFFISSKFEKWKYDLKQGIQKNKLVDERTHIAVLESLDQQAGKFSEMMAKKEKDVHDLEMEIKGLNGVLRGYGIDSSENPSDPQMHLYRKEYEVFSKKPAYNDFLHLVLYLRGKETEWKGQMDLGDIYVIYLGKQIIEKSQDHRQGHWLTDKGNKFYTWYMEDHPVKKE